MPQFRLFRMREEKRQQFRWAPHTSGSTPVKPRDFEEAVPVDATNVYSLWAEMKSADQPLDVGDVVELPGGELRICKYVGFEEAKWVMPEMRTGIEMDAPPASGGRPRSLAAGA
jgi:hypothetical protein